MSLKSLVEKKNALIAEAEAMLNVAETEVRGLNAEENSAYEAKLAEIKEIENTITKMEERNKNLEVIEEKIEGEERNMDNVLETELRGLEQYMRSQIGDEARAMTTSTTGAVVPTHLHGEVIKKLEEVAPLFSMVPKLTPVAGTLEILKETDIEKAGFVGESTNLDLKDFTMGKVKLEQRRCGSAAELSQHLINDAGIDIVGYTKEVLYRRLGYALDRAMVNGVKADSFEGLNGAPATCEVQSMAGDAVAIEDFMNVLNAMHPSLQAGAVWVMSREIFNKVALLKDGVGNFYLLRQLNVVTQKPEYRLLGCPIYINDAVDNELTEGKKIAFLVNFAQAYKGMIKKDMELKHISGDTVNSLKGTHTFTLDIYADAKIVQEDAVKVLKVKAA